MNALPRLPSRALGVLLGLLAALTLAVHALLPATTPAPLPPAPLPAPLPAVASRPQPVSAPRVPDPIAIEATAYHVEMTATHVYWTQASYEDTGVLAHLMRAPIDGGPTELIARDAGFDFVIAGDSIYYASTPDPALRKVALDGGDSTLVARSPSEPYSLAIGGDHVYWTTKRGVMRAPLDGGKAVRLGVGRAQDPIAADSEFVYIAGRELVRIAHGARTASKLATFTVQPSEIVVAGQALLVALDHTLVRVPRDGGSVETLATGGFAHRLAQTRNAVYWTSWSDERVPANGCASFEAGTVRRIDAELGTVERIESGCDVRGFAASDHAGFVVEHARLVRRTPQCIDAAFAARNDELWYRIEGGESHDDAARGARVAHAQVLERCTRERWSARTILDYRPQR